MYIMFETTECIIQSDVKLNVYHVFFFYAIIINVFSKYWRYIIRCLILLEQRKTRIFRFENDGIIGIKNRFIGVKIFEII